MKRLLFFTAVLLTGAALAVAAVRVASPQETDLVEQIIARIRDARVEFDYSYSVAGKVPVQASGHACFEGRRYHLEGNGLVIRCDGVSRWTADPKTREVYIEKAGGPDAALENPEAFLRSARDLKYDGDSLSGTVRLEDGSELSCRLTGIRTQAASGSLDGFRMDTGTLGKDWIITDLR